MKRFLAWTVAILLIIFGLLWLNLRDIHPRQPPPLTPISPTFPPPLDTPDPQVFLVPYGDRE